MREKTIRDIKRLCKNTEINERQINKSKNIKVEFRQR